MGGSDGIARDCRAENGFDDSCSTAGWGKPLVLLRAASSLRIRRRRRMKQIKHREQMKAMATMGMKMAAKSVPRASPLEVDESAACTWLPRMPDTCDWPVTADVVVELVDAVDDGAGVPVVAENVRSATAATLGAADVIDAGDGDGDDAKVNGVTDEDDVGASAGRACAWFSLAATPPLFDHGPSRLY